MIPVQDNEFMRIYTTQFIAMYNESLLLSSVSSIYECHEIDKFYKYSFPKQSITHEYNTYMCYTVLENDIL